MVRGLKSLVINPPSLKLRRVKQTNPPSLKLRRVKQTNPPSLKLRRVKQQTHLRFFSEEANTKVMDSKHPAPSDYLKGGPQLDSMPPAPSNSLKGGPQPLKKNNPTFAFFSEEANNKVMAGMPPAPSDYLKGGPQLDSMPPAPSDYLKGGPQLDSKPPAPSDYLKGGPKPLNENNEQQTIPLRFFSEEALANLEKLLSLLKLKRHADGG
jgi:hypothetical protein